MILPLSFFLSLFFSFFLSFFLSLSLTLSIYQLTGAATGADSEFTSKMKNRPAADPKLTKSSSVGGEMCSLGRNDDDEDDKKRRSSFGARMAAMVGLGKKSQSTSQLDPEGKTDGFS